MERQIIHHPTILKLVDTIELNKCKKDDCCKQRVHCPFCDLSHLKPMNAYRIRDHLELAHFQHGVYYKDLLMVKCYQDCKQKAGGHYHCPMCTSTIIKRLCFQSHLLSHVNKLHQNKNVISMPDSRHPRQIKYYGYTVSLCYEKCQGSSGNHYHCPKCAWLGHDRSVLIFHLWRCEETISRTEESIKKSKNKVLNLSVNLHDTGSLENIPELHPKENTDFKWHVSIVRTLTDLPIQKCTVPECCEGMFHCVLCRVERFTPSSKEELVSHHMSHWKGSLPYKGYSILCCYNECGKPDGELLTMPHYHCPVCGTLRRQKEPMFSHLQICQGEGIKPRNYSDVFKHSSKPDLGVLTDIEFGEEMEQEQEEKVDISKIYLETTQSEDMPDASELLQMGDNDKTESCAEIQACVEPDTLNTDTGSTSVEHEGIGKNDIFESVTAVVSSECLSRLGAAEEVQALMETITKATGTTCIVHPDSGTQVLVGDIDSIVQTRNLLFQSVNGFKMVDTPVGEMEENLTVENGQDESVDADSTLNNSTDNRGSRHHDGCQGDNNSASADSEDSGRGIDVGETSNVDSLKENSLIDQNMCLSTQDGSKVLDIQKQPSKCTNSTKSPTSADNTTKNSNRKLRSDKKLKRNDESVKNPSQNDNNRHSRRYSTRNKQVDFSELAGYKKKESVGVVAVKGGKKKKKEPSGICSVDFSAVKHTSHALDHSLPEEEKNKMSIGINTDYNSDMKEEVSNKDVKSNVVSERDIDNTPGWEVKEQITANEKSEVDCVEESRDSTNMEVEVIETQPDIMHGVARIPTVKFLFEVKNNKCKQTKTSLPNQDDDFDGADVKQTVLTKDTKQKNLSCKACDFVSDSFQNLTSHLLTIHEEIDSFRCDICERAFSQKSYLDRHLSLKHGPINKDSSFRCTLCETELDSKAILNWHMSKFHGHHKGKKSMRRVKTCSQCPFQTKLAVVMRHHRLTVHDEVPQCEFCGRRFAKVTLLRAHIQTVHTKEKSCVCHVCGKAFSHVRYLHSHLRRHTGVRNHACSVCGFRFYDGNSLKDHMETHKDKKERTYKYICSYCGKGFRNKSNFNDHLNKHTGNKPYQCGLCGRCFGFRSELGKHHMFIHSSDKPFKCTLCEKAFKLKRLRDNHMTIHNGRSAYVCHSCHRPFSCKATLKVHETKCHKLVLRSLGHDDTDVFSNEASLEIHETKSSKFSSQSLVQDATDTLPVQNIVITLPDGTEIPALEPERIELYSDVVQVAELVNEVNQSEVFLCSECNATFDNYSLAEQHVMLCHMEPKMEVAESDLPSTETLSNETMNSVNAIITDNNSIISINTLEEGGM
ncbi:hypothetical protein ScPMuIL_007766 [Solemya velum]